MSAAKTWKAELQAWSLAVSATALATLARFALSPLVGTAVPFLTYFVAVVLVVWYRGFRPAAVAIVLSLMAGTYFFLSPDRTFLITSRADRVTVLGFAFVSVAVAFLLALQRRTLERANAEAVRRRSAENAERQQRERFETTLASIGDAVITTDTDGRIVFANRVAQSLLRLPMAELAGKPLDQVFQIINELTREKVESPVTRVLREGTVVGLANHTSLVAHDGTEIPIDDSGAPIRGEGGAVQGAVLVFRDVTARRRAEEAGRLLASIVASSEDAIISKDLDGVITSWNQGAERIFGYSASEMIGRPISTIVPPDRLDEMVRILERIRRGERIEQFDSVRAKKNGELVNVALTISPIYDSTGRIVGASKIARDVTSRKRDEDQLRELNTNLGRANADLERFAFAASHDLQEPLRMITTFAQFLANTTPGPPHKDAPLFIQNIIDGTDRMRELLADLLTYTEIAERQEPVEPVDLNLVIDTVLKNLQLAIDETCAVITTDPMPILSANKAHWISLFQNLIGNALKYRGQEPPRIHVSVQETEGEFRFTVADNGMGIDPEYHESIFGIFKRLHGKKIPGTGIGLAICQRIVERYGGRIWVESEPGRGANFVFTLPGITRGDR